MTKEEFINYDRKDNIEIHQIKGHPINNEEDSGWWALVFRKLNPVIGSNDPEVAGYGPMIEWILSKFPDYNKENMIFSYIETLYGPYHGVIYIKPKFDE